MATKIAWVLNSPWPMLLSWALGMFHGFLIGRSTKTRKIEMQRNAAMRDLRTIQRAVVLVSAANPSSSDKPGGVDG